MGIKLETGRRRNSIANRNDSPPFGELRAELLVLLHPSPESVQSLGHDFPWESRYIHRSFVDFDARHNPFLGKNLRKRRAVTGGRANGFVEKNNAADRFFDSFGG